MKNVATNLIALAVLVFLLFRLFDDFTSQYPVPVANRGAITIGAEPMFPYQYEQSASDGRLTGLSVELIREACSRAGYRPTFVQHDWHQLLDMLEKGQLDALSLAFRSPEREKYGHFGTAYLRLNYAVFFRNDRYERLPGDPEQLLQLAKQDQWRVGYSRGYAYPKEIALFHNQTEAIPSNQEAEALAQLTNGQVDVVFCDELAGLSTIMRNRWNSEIGFKRLNIPLADVHILYNKKRVRPQVRARIDSALLSMESDGTASVIVRAYHYPVLLNLLERTFLFDPIALLAVATAAASGIFLARKEGYNLLGAFLLAAAPAVGGGLLRDLVAGRRPIGFVASPTIMTTVLIMVLAGFLFFRLVFQFWPERARRVLELDVENIPLLIVCDALGLACFTIIGVIVALQWRCEPLWMWGPILAAVTNGGGSLLRDILRHQPSDSLRTTRLYVEISVLWGLAFSVFLIYYSAHPPHQVIHLQAAMLATVLGVLLTRFLTLRNKFSGPTF